MIKKVYGSSKGGIYKHEIEGISKYYTIEYEGYNWCKRYTYREARECYSRMVKGQFVEHK